MEPRFKPLVLRLVLRLLLFCSAVWTSAVSLNLSDGETIESCSRLQQIPCNNVTLCSDAIGILPPDEVLEAMLERTCYCDRVCRFYGDCCRDHPSPFFVGASPEDSVRDQTECLHIDGVETNVPILLVTSCPVTWVDQAVREYCERDVLYEEVFLRWPVSDSTGVVFKNVYCAVCNGRETFIYWESKFLCTDAFGNETNSEFQAILKERFREGECKVEFFPVGHDLLLGVRPCRELVDQCPMDWPDHCVRERCRDEEAAFVLSRQTNVLYRNYYCAECNDDVIDSCDDATDVTLGPNVSLFTDPRFYPLTILLDLNSGTGTTLVGHEYGDPIEKVTTEIKTCPTKHVYDPYAEVCRSVLCPELYFYANDSCHPLNGSAPGVGLPIDCIYYSLNQSEYVLLNNGTVFIIARNTTHQADEYEFGPNGTIILCGNFSQNYTQETVEYLPQIMLKFDKAQTVLSLVGQIVSLIALAIHFIIYLILPQMRNLAGKNLMSLVASLFWAQLLFLVGIGMNDILELCQTIAILMHFTFLASFFWMNVMSYDIWRTFTHSTSSPSPRTLSKRFVHYSLYAWISPFVIVMAAVAVEFSGVDSILSPSYGFPVCWICSRPSLMLFFGLPVLCILLANFGFYILTVITLYKVSKSTKTLTKSNSASDKNRLLLYTKLSALMGLTWAFSFIAALADLAVIWYFFLIFNTLQGLFICLGFACNARVLHLLREKANKLKKPKGYDMSNEDHSKVTFFSRLIHGSHENIHKVQLRSYISKQDT